MRRIVALPVLVVGTYRSEEVGRAHPLRGLRRRLETEESLERIALGRFDRAVVAEIAQRHFHDVEDPHALAADLYRYSEGVPLFLDEAIHSGKGAAPGARLNVPERLERLGEKARLLAEIAAVIGAGFTVEVLCEVAGWDETDVLRALDETRRSALRARRQPACVRRLRVRASPRARRRVREPRRCHAPPPPWPSQWRRPMLYDERADHAAEIAMQYDRGGDPASAASAYVVAAVHALGLYASDEALAHAERALALGCASEDAIDMQLLRATVGHWIARSDLREAALAAIDPAAATPRQRLRFERLRIVHALLASRLDEADAAAERYLRAAIAVEDGTSVVMAHLEKATIAITWATATRKRKSISNVRGRRCRRPSTADCYVFCEPKRIWPSVADPSLRNFPRPRSGCSRKRAASTIRTPKRRRTIAWHTSR